MQEQGLVEPSNISLMEEQSWVKQVSKNVNLFATMLPLPLLLLWPADGAGGDKEPARGLERGFHHHVYACVGVTDQTLVA